MNLKFLFLLTFLVVTLIGCTGGEDDCFPESIIGEYEGTITCDNGEVNTVTYEIFSVNEISFSFAEKLPFEEYSLEFIEKECLYLLSDVKLVDEVDTLIFDLSIKYMEETASFLIESDINYLNQNIACKITAERGVGHGTNVDGNSYDLSISRTFDKKLACICDQEILDDQFTTFSTWNFTQIELTNFGLDYRIRKSTVQPYGGTQGFGACWTHDNGTKAVVSESIGLTIFNFNGLGSFINENRVSNLDHLQVTGMQRVGQNEFVIAGTHSPGLVRDLFLAKIKDDELVWEKILDFNKFDFYGDLQILQNGNLLFYSIDGLGSGDIRITQFDIEKGDIVDSILFDEVNAANRLGDLIELEDGSIIICSIREQGFIDYDIQMIRFKLNGEVIWSKYFEWPEYDSPRVLKLDQDNNLLVGGATSSFGYGQFDMLLLKMDLDGNLIWRKNYGNEFDNQLSSIALMKDGGYLLSGGTTDRPDRLGSNMLLIEVDKDGRPR